MIDRVILEIQLAQPNLASQPFSAYQRCEPGIQTGERGTRHRQQLAIPPQIARSAGDLVAPHPGARRGVIVRRLERPQALVTDEQRFGRKLGATEMTSQPCEVAQDLAFA